MVAPLDGVEAHPLGIRFRDTSRNLYTATDAEHIDLYDQVDRIPFDKLESFFKDYLNVILPVPVHCPNPGNSLESGQTQIRDFQSVSDPTVSVGSLVLTELSPAGLH